MKKQVIIAVSFINAILLFTYFCMSFSSVNIEKTIDDFEEKERVEHKNVHVEELEISTINHTYSYSYLTRCSMWNTQPPPARLPRWVREDPSCRRYLYVPFHYFGGFGHKSDNFMNGLILSSALNFPYLMTGDFETCGRHTSLSGAVDRLGIGQYSPSEFSVGCKRKDVGFDNSLHTYDDIIKQASKDERLNECNTYYNVGEFFAGDRSPVRWHMAHMVQSRLASKRTTDIKYDRNKFNIAIHMRYGSSSPYSVDQTLEIYNKNSSNTVRMIKYFTTELEQIGVPYAVHFFTAGEVKEDLLSAFPGAIVHGKDMSVPDTIQHFIESDLLFCLMSSMCRAASIMSTRPLVVNGYPTSEAYFYDPCPRGLSCDIINRTAEPDLALKKRIRDAGERWLVSHMLNCPVE